MRLLCPRLSTVPNGEKIKKQYVLMQYLISALSANQNPERAKKGEAPSFPPDTSPFLSVFLCVFSSLDTDTVF